MPFRRYSGSTEGPYLSDFDKTRLMLPVLVADGLSRRKGIYPPACCLTLRTEYMQNCTSPRTVICFAQTHVSRLTRHGQGSRNMMKVFYKFFDPYIVQNKGRDYLLLYILSRSDFLPKFVPDKQTNRGVKSRKNKRMVFPKPVPKTPVPRINVV